MGLQFGDLREQVFQDDLYRRAAALSEGLSVVSEANRMNLFLNLRFGLGEVAPGHIVEFGAYRGGNAIFMAAVCRELHPGIRVHARDTFSGMPPVDSSRDAHRAGDFGDAGYDELRDEVVRLGLDNLSLVRGTFELTAPDLLRKIGSVRLAHIDCDIYSAVAYSYDVTLPHMAEGGYWVFDDALYSSCIGAMEAIEERVIQRNGRFAEQPWPQLVYRNLSPTG